MQYIKNNVNKTYHVNKNITSANVLRKEEKKFSDRNLRYLLNLTKISHIHLDNQKIVRAISNCTSILNAQTLTFFLD